MTRLFERMLLLFLLLRMGLVAITIVNPTGALLTDSTGYVGLARGLVEHGRYGLQPDGEPDMLRPPAYSGIIALLQVVTGPGTAQITLLNLAISAVTCWLIVLTGRQLGSPDAGVIGGWIYALSPNVALWSLMVMTEVLFAALLALASLLVIHGESQSRTRWPTAIGVVLGVGAYVRPIALVLVPVWTIISFRILRRTLDRRRAMLRSATLLVVGILLALPWAYRNWSTYGQFTFSTVTSKTWIGFNLAEVVARAEGTNRNRAVASLERTEGIIPLTLSVISSYPAEFVKAQVVGVARSLAGTDMGTWGFALGDKSWVGLGLLSGAFWGADPRLPGGDGLESGDAVRLGILSYSFLFSGAMLLLAGFGLLARSPRTPQATDYRWLTVATLAVLLILPGAAGQARFRVPAEPFLAVLAGLGLMWAADRVNAWRADRLLQERAAMAQAEGSD